MNIVVSPCDLRTIEPLHALYRREANCQVIRDSFWPRGLLDAYRIEIDESVAGYGAMSNRYDKGRIIEFYVIPSLRRYALRMFRELLVVSEATQVEAQTNIPLMLRMVSDCAVDLKTEYVLFADTYTTNIVCPHGGYFRGLRAENELPVFEHHHEPRGEWVVEAGGSIVATGGFLTHYNPPYADLFMEVEEGNRGQGYGSYLIQELKRVCYESGKVPAARCNPANEASRSTLEKAGLLACGHLLTGALK